MIENKNERCEKAESFLRDLKSLNRIMGTAIEQIYENKNLLEDPDFRDIFIGLYKKAKFLQEAKDYNQYNLSNDDKDFAEELCNIMTQSLFAATGIEESIVIDYLEKIKLEKKADESLAIIAENLNIISCAKKDSAIEKDIKEMFSDCSVVDSHIIEKNRLGRKKSLKGGY